MDELFEISEDVSDRACVVTVAGEVDVASAPTLRSRLEAAIDRGTPLVVVDLLSVTFIDSTGLGVLIGASKRVDNSGGTMHLVVTEPRILKLFEITGLMDLFSIVPSVEQAVGP
ncbi:MAG TPA: STAS domain-containing protein [Acidimicrobiales bacterium]|jgi:anti-sigma B factor antagonist|nr:STAS domain-containing protein [Acidimicrobiales bacterium]